MHLFTYHLWNWPRPLPSPPAFRPAHQGRGRPQLSFSSLFCTLEWGSSWLNSWLWSFMERPDLRSPLLHLWVLAAPVKSLDPSLSDTFCGFLLVSSRMDIKILKGQILYKIPVGWICVCSASPWDVSPYFKWSSDCSNFSIHSESQMISSETPR